MSMLCVACAEDPTGRCGMHKARGVDEEVRPLGPGAGKFGDPASRAQDQEETPT